VSVPTDLRYALRLLMRQRATTLLVVLTLALGIGATSAMFSVIHGVLLRPLPYDAPERIVRMHPYSQQRADSADSSTPADYLDLARDVRAFEAVAGFMEQVVDFSDGAGDPERVSGLQVTERFFDVFRVPAALGRTFESAHAATDRGTAVVLRHSFWLKRLGGSPTVIGRQVRINGQPKTIVGVMPPEFGFRQDEALWLLAPRDVPDPPIASCGRSPSAFRRRMRNAACA
jgi:putative ABC transport system permease protein